MRLIIAYNAILQSFCHIGVLWIERLCSIVLVYGKIIEISLFIFPVYEYDLKLFYLNNMHRVVCYCKAILM